MAEGTGESGEWFGVTEVEEHSAAVAAGPPLRRRGRGVGGRVGRRRHRGVLRVLGVVAVVASVLVMSPLGAGAIGDGPVASQPTPEYVRPATPDTDPVDLRGGVLGLDLVEDEGVWLYTSGLEASTTWANAGPDPGVAFIVQCYGPGIASGGTGWYVARNLDPPNNTFTFRPQIRTMFVAPASGAYTCRLRVAAYQPNSSITIPVIFHAGATLHATPVKPTSSAGVTAGYGWTVPNSGNNPQPHISAADPTLRHNYGNYTFHSSSSPNVTIIMDQNVTTCAPGDTFAGCQGATSGGTTVKTTLVVQPQHLDGTPCGVSTPLQVFTHTMTVITAYHHYPILNTAILNKAADLFGCPRVNIALDLTWISGQAMVVHTLRPSDERPGWGGIYEHS
jgi:hypothetical protein